MRFEGLRRLWQIDKQERLKVLLLGLVYLCIIGAYTMAKELKEVVFISTVGLPYLPEAKTLALFILVPAILLHGMLVDRLKRYQLIYFYSLFYAAGTIISAVLLSHPTIGLANTVADKWRLFGWFFYFFIEGYTPFIISLFWAYSNTVSSPRAAQQGYPFVVALSKMGGMLTAGLGWALFGHKLTALNWLSEIQRMQFAMVISGLFLCIIPLLIKLLIRIVPARHLHGYEAVYRHEKQQEKKQKNSTSDLLSGLRLLFKYPYVLGIFGMLFFYEVIDTVLNFQRLGLTRQAATCVGDFACSLYGQVFFTHFFGFFISIFGTTILLRILGEQWALLSVPLMSMFLLCYFIIDGSIESLLIVYQCMTAINFVVGYPIREALYIPTVKEVRYKSKSWIDAFGSKLSKTVGSTFNKASVLLGGGSISGAMSSTLFAVFVGIIGTCWIVAAYLLGIRYVKVISNNEIIGAEEEEAA